MLTWLASFIREQRVKKLVSMRRIETTINEEQRRCYSIAHVAFGLVNVRRKLEATPTAITFGGDSFFTREWSIPTAELFPSCVTYFRQEQSIVIGINYQKKFYPISSELSTDEIESLAEELRTFIQRQQPSSATRQTVSPKFQTEQIENQGIRFLIPHQLTEVKTVARLGLLFGCFLVMPAIFPWRLEGFSLSDYAFFFFLVSLFLIPSTLLISLCAALRENRAFHALEITPKNMYLVSKWFAIPFGDRKIVALSQVKPSALNWYYKEKRLMISIMLENMSLEFAPDKYVPADADALICKLRETVVQMKNTPVSAEMPLGASCSPEGMYSEKIRLDERRWQYRIPGNFNEIVRDQLALPTVLTIIFGGINGFAWIVSTTPRDWLFHLLLLFFFGVVLGWLTIVVHHILGKTILTLSPQWIRIKYALFGLSFTRRVSANAVTGVSIVDRYSVKNKGQVARTIQGINLRTGRKTLRFGSHLPTGEKNWLVEEIKAFLATVSMPSDLSELDAKIRITDNRIEIAFPRFSIIWPFWTNEIISIAANTLTLCVKTFKQGRSQQFNVKEINNFRIAEKGDRDGTLLFDYYQVPITFARHLSDAEAATLCKQLNDILTFRCQAVEQIVFGEMPPTFIGTPETLLMNPDVSELSFPFIRLQRLILDAATHDPRRVERFLTYAVNAIGQRKLKESVDVHIYGDPALLQTNLRNNLDNLFRRVEIHSEIGE